MAKISLKNFRKFESLDSLELGWINLFVGKNNAGKSTVVKAIMLALDNIRSLRWTNLKSEDGLVAMQNAPKPLFRFDANGFHNLHIGTFERAKCNYLDNRRVTISLEYEGFEFEIIVAGVMEGSQVSMPIEKMRVSMPLHSNYEFDFSRNTMTFSLGAKLTNVPSDETEKAICWVNDEIAMTDDEIKAAAKDGNALKVAGLQQQLQKLQTRKKSLQTELKQLESKTVVNHATFDLSYFHDTIGENILVQYLRTFVKLADTPINKLSGTGGTLIPATKLDKRTLEYREEEAKRQYVAENRKFIEDAAKKLEKLLNNVYVEYIQAHAATQKLILSVDDKQDINSRVIHEYYQEGIQLGETADRFVKKWLKEFEIGDAINIKPLDGEGYYVKVDTEDDDVHLADMGMGSIQLIILLLRLATIGNRSDVTLRPWWVIIEEPEQNLHPMLQSKLADLFEDFTQTFCDPYSNTLIIETHSEYLIRRTQLIVSEKVESFGDEMIDEINPFKVYYFPSEKGKQPYDMEYSSNGRFRNSFAPGFYDEAGSLALELSEKERKTRTSEEFNWEGLDSDSNLGQEEMCEFYDNEDDTNIPQTELLSPLKSSFESMSINTSKIRAEIHKNDVSEENLMRFINIYDDYKYSITDKKQYNCFSIGLYEEEENGFLILVFANGSVSKISIHELILGKTRDVKDIHSKSPIVFATLALPNYTLAILYRTGNKEYYRLMTIDRLPINSFNFAGRPFYNGNIEEIIKCEIIPEITDSYKYKKFLDVSNNIVGGDATNINGENVESLINRFLTKKN